MPERRKKFTPEFKDEAVRAVIEQSRPIAQVVRELSVHEGTLGKWVNNYREEHAGEKPPLSISERAQLRELKRRIPSFVTPTPSDRSATISAFRSGRCSHVRAARSAMGMDPGPDLPPVANQAGAGSATEDRNVTVEGHDYSASPHPGDSGGTDCAGGDFGGGRDFGGF